MALQPPEKIRIVCATRHTKDDFFVKSALGRSLEFYKFPFVELRLFDTNSRGLPTVYNAAIEEAAQDPAILVFAHDDLHLCDFHWVGGVFNAVRTFDVAGLAGNKQRVPKQPGWLFVDDTFTIAKMENLSGVVGHGKGFPPDQISFYGPPFQPVKLLDGLMLIARSEMLHKKALRFDERFDFHFYDLDFCRSAEAKNLKLGTWAISVVHESGGAFGSDGWKKAYAAYLAKWGE
jgi:GT2 family glycosyltransferase